jgi:hypothetical protein
MYSLTAFRQNVRPWTSGIIIIVFLFFGKVMHLKAVYEIVARFATIWKSKTFYY